MTIAHPRTIRRGRSRVTARARINVVAATTFVVLAANLLAIVPAHAAPGDLDVSFSGDGRQTTDFGGSAGGASVAIQADGKIVVAGSGSVNGPGGDFALARYNPDGSLDDTFSADGMQTTDFAGNDQANGVVIQPDGKIVAAGRSYNFITGATDFALARYNVDGSLDGSFGYDGRRLTDFEGGVDGARDLSLQQSDGKIVAAGESASGFALARYNPDGSLDATFSDDGKQTTDFPGSDHASGVVIQADDGKIVAAGGSAGDFALARYDPDGSLDATFSDDGKQTTDFADSEQANGVVMQADGKIVAAGGLYGIGDFALARYNPDGSLDDTFSDDGMQTTDSWAEEDYAAGVALQADGKIVTAGRSYCFICSSTDFVLARYNADGSLDSSFGAFAGRLITDFDGGVEGAEDLALQSDGKIVAVGSGSGTSGNGELALARYHGGSGAAEPGTAPANSSPPTISGTGTEGQTLTANPGTWSGSIPVNQTYQWRRCDSTGTNCVEIAAATATTYTLSAADVGHTIRVRETAANAYGTDSVDSAATAVVRARLGAIAGTVYSASHGTAIAGASVSCGTGYSAKTGSAGTYSIANVAPGSYSCTASAKHHKPSTQTVRVDSGQISTSDFRLVRR